jgi:hypothetical protein
VAFTGVTRMVVAVEDKTNLTANIKNAPSIFGAFFHITFAY